MKDLIERLDTLTEAKFDAIPNDAQKEIAGLVQGMAASSFLGSGDHAAELVRSGPEESSAKYAAEAGKMYGIVIGMYAVWEKLEQLGLVKKGLVSKAMYKKADASAKKVK